MTRMGGNHGKVHTLHGSGARRWGAAMTVVAVAVVLASCSSQSSEDSSGDAPVVASPRVSATSTKTVDQPVEKTPEKPAETLFNGVSFPTEVPGFELVTTVTQEEVDSHPLLLIDAWMAYQQNGGQGVEGFDGPKYVDEVYDRTLPPGQEATTVLYRPVVDGPRKYLSYLVVQVKPTKTPKAAYKPTISGDDNRLWYSTASNGLGWELVVRDVTQAQAESLAIAFSNRS